MKLEQQEVDFRRMVSKLKHGKKKGLSNKQNIKTRNWSIICGQAA